MLHTLFINKQQLRDITEHLDELAYSEMGMAIGDFSAIAAAQFISNTDIRDSFLALCDYWKDEVRKALTV